MSAKVYKARTLKGAQARVHQLQKICDAMEKRLQRYRAERHGLAMLAADGPCFDNPLIVYEWRNVRDQILLKECRLTPDGKAVA